MREAAKASENASWSRPRAAKPGREGTEKNRRHVASNAPSHRAGNRVAVVPFPRENPQQANPLQATVPEIAPLDGSNAEQAALLAVPAGSESAVAEPSDRSGIVEAAQPEQPSEPPAQPAENSAEPSASFLLAGLAAAPSWDAWKDDFEQRLLQHGVRELALKTWRSVDAALSGAAADGL